MILLADKVTPFTEHVGVPIAVAIVGLLATLGAAAISFALSLWNDTSARRRDGYSTATKELVAWAEYPYRIRRRTSDEPAELTRLANIGHDLQEALRYRQTWITAENGWTGKIFAEVRSDLGAIAGSACANAWNAAPISKASDMNLNGWDPPGIEAHLERFESAVRFRFGWRRLVAVTGWHPGAHPRPSEVRSEKASAV